MKIVFWLSLGMILYTYAGYPLALSCLGAIKPRRIKPARQSEYPLVSVIIAAHNEESRIREKIANTLGLDYPKDRMCIIVISDGSTDRTELISSEFARDGVRTIRLPERSGKSAAINLGVSIARGDIFVFTDAGAVAEPDCLRRLISNFSDPEVGCVSSEDAIIGDESSGEGAYVKYEMLLRRLETRVGSCLAASGSFYAIRKHLCPVFPPATATDFLSVLETVGRGYRAISDPAALARMGTVQSSGDEFRRKVRTVLTGVACLPEMLPLLNALRYGLFSFELLSHKLLRWTSGAFLPPLLVSNAMLVSESGFYAFAIIAQALFYCLALVGSLSPRFRAASRVIRFPFFFLCANISALLACWKYIRGERAAIWQPSRRAQEARV